MKAIFEMDDFRSGGQMIIRARFKRRSDGAPDWGYASTIAYKVGYIIDAETGYPSPALTNLSDGKITQFATDREFLDMVNNKEDSFRPMTYDEIENVMREVGNRF